MRLAGLPFAMGMVMGPMMALMVHTLGAGALWGFVALHVAALAAVLALAALALRWTPLKPHLARLRAWHRPRPAHLGRMVAGGVAGVALLCLGCLALWAGGV
ncbi:hypothetical protein [Roseivivax sp. CAU 1753]